MDKNRLGNINISIVLCCYNSVTRITPTLEHLAKQILRELSCELILVDNNCTDNTVDVSNKVWTKNGAPFPLTIVTECNPGLSNARKAGILAAKGEIIVFCDDDNWLEENYIRISHEIMISQSDIGVLGGRSQAVFENNEPFWFTTYQGAYAVGVQALRSGDVSKRTFVWGAGCVLRKALLIRLYDAGFVNLCTGRISGVILSGEDTEICFWHLLVGYRLWYDERLTFRHYIAKERCNVNYLEQLRDGSKKSYYYLQKYSRILKYVRNNKRNNRLNYIKLFLQLVFFRITLKEFFNRLSIRTKLVFKYTDPLIAQILQSINNYSKNIQ